MSFLLQNDIGKLVCLKLFIPVLCFVTLAGCDNRNDDAQVQFLPPGSAYIDPGTRSLNNFFDCLESENVPLISAHRGGVTENSIHGMNTTLAGIPAIMEVDVNVSADGVLFLLHDDTLDRTTTGTGSAAERNWNYIRSLKIKGPADEIIDESPPRLSDVLEWADGKTLLQLDIKRAVRYEDVIKAVKDAGATDEIIYIAYTFGQARRLHQLHPEAMISVTLDEPGELSEITRDIPADRIVGWTGNTAPDRAVFDELNAADVEVIFGTLGGRDSIDNKIMASGKYDYYAQLVRDGVDIIGTDQGEIAYSAMKKAGLTMSSPACGVFVED